MFLSHTVHQIWATDLDSQHQHVSAVSSVMFGAIGQPEVASSSVCVIVSFSCALCAESGPELPEGNEDEMKTFNEDIICSHGDVPISPAHQPHGKCFLLRQPTCI